MQHTHFQKYDRYKILMTNIYCYEKESNGIKWDHFDILAYGKTDLHCKIKETLFIQELQPLLNANVGSERLLLY